MRKILFLTVTLLLNSSCQKCYNCYEVVSTNGKTICFYPSEAKEQLRTAEDGKYIWNEQDTCIAL